MAETICVLCGEPWDTHHINHDAPFHVRALFRAGKGCECCKGVQPASKPDIENLGQTLLFGGDDDDSMDMICAIEDGTADKDWNDAWEDAELNTYELARCAGCETIAEYDAEEVWGLWDEKTEEWVPAIAVFAREVGDSSSGLVSDYVKISIADIKAGTGKAFGHTVKLTHLDSSWDFSEVLGKTLCADCHTSCDGVTDNGNPCEAWLYTGVAHSQFVSDTYDEGSSFYIQDINKTLCSDCMERLPGCNHCGSAWDFDDSDAVFIEDDEYRCTDCTSFKECDECERWVPEEDLQHSSTVGGEIKEESFPNCAECRLKRHPPVVVTDIVYPEYTKVTGCVKHACDEPACDEIATKRSVHHEDDGPVFTCSLHTRWAALHLARRSE